MSPLILQSLTFGAILFSIGLVGFLTRRNLILMFLSLELMLAGVSTNFIAFGAHYGHFGGQIFSILILTVASCEAAMALALVVALFRVEPSLDIWTWSWLNERPDDAWKREDVADDLSTEDTPHPNLTPAGRDPMTSPTPDRMDQEVTGTKA